MGEAKRRPKVIEPKGKPARWKIKTSWKFWDWAKDKGKSRPEIPKRERAKARGRAKRAAGLNRKGLPWGGGQGS